MSSVFLPRQLEVGEKSLESIGKIATRQGISHLFVIIDAFLTTDPLNYDVKIKQILDEEHVRVTFFSDYHGEPTTDHLNGALKKLHDSNADGVLSLGGGSAIDIGKAVALFAKNPYMKWEAIASQTRLDRLPLMALPTTAGTGSEATKVMVVKNSETEVKMNPGHPDLAPDVAILDPLLTTSLPRHFTAYTGMDALTHAIEAYVSTNASRITDDYALNAINLVGKNLHIAYEEGSNVKSREEMLLASCYAGTAFSNASTNLAHAAGRPLGARFYIPHGLSVALLLPFVMRFGVSAVPERYATIAVALGEDSSKDVNELAEKSIVLVEEYNRQFGIWQDGLKYIDIEDLKVNLSTIVDDALSGNGITTNRIIPTKKDVEEVLLALVEKLHSVKHENIIN
ncbi:iron-containing alcohol dehydrogenase [Virgibacillus sp. NKC19-16]|uniref:iron-containing alcohol dehydrogenase n=1 Tax=Virgibacillus salidurans TaxID=2831673 RepID=UPI001F2ECC99|nr:iron-containing alcohol dehydrogenase [Virgibacillus sp. NKC19-16]UJL45697.1 iron-containing alcohol dehydrogenase [Virgibacillus sp. NKC19-16]